MLVQSIQSRSLDQTTRTRGYTLLEYVLDSLRRDSMASTKRFKLLTGGTQRVKGTAEKANVKNNCNTIWDIQRLRQRIELGISKVFGQSSAFFYKAKEIPENSLKLVEEVLREREREKGLKKEQRKFQKQDEEVRFVEN